ncbi:MAG: hypothetical protein NXH85_01025 [Pseudomonadaceae bacterium]|nr:hypothetical protein [Pseudomonadaceae bacterium]
MFKRSAPALILIMLSCGITAAEQPDSEQTFNPEETLIKYDPDGPVLGVEVARLSDAMAADLLAGDHGSEISVVAFFGPELRAATNAEERLDATVRFADLLFQSATTADVLDDRALYWARLMMRQTLQGQMRLSGVDTQETEALVAAMEWHSRGMDLSARIAAARKQGVTRVAVVTGFDPFFLDVDITQSNPSGLAALALDGVDISIGHDTVRIVSAVFPVRFQDFDDGLVERFVAGIDDAQASLFLTVSMGREGFDLERFPGLRRSATAPDNRNVVTGASASHPIKAELDGKPIEGPEFVEFSLPAEAMVGCESGPYEVRDNREVTTLEGGQFEASSLAQLDGHRAVEGSGGGYLSNEISYRVVRALQARGSTVPAGHLHTPRVAGYDAQAEQAIVGQIKALVSCAIAAIHGV